MREQLTQYVNLLFAGAKDADEIRAEILQNTLERYDDLVAQGKSPEAAYRLAIGGIGDVNEILGTSTNSTATHAKQQHSGLKPEVENDTNNRKLRAIGIAMYIISAIPLFILSDFGFETIGLTITILLVACATYIMITTAKHHDDDESDKTTHQSDDSSPSGKLKKSIESLIWAIGLALYFILSFTTKAWYITWIIFPIIGCTDGLFKAIMDLWEESKHEN